MNEKSESGKQSFFEKAASFIVDKRKAFYLLYIGLAVFCMFSSGWVSVNGDLTSYLAPETETRQGLTLMDEEFTTFGTNRVMVDNISLGRAESIAESLRQTEGVKSVDFDGGDAHYRNGAALFEVTYDVPAEDGASLESRRSIEKELDGLDYYITGEVETSSSDQLNSEMRIVIIVAAVIILLVLLFTSKTYMEIPVMLMTFGMAALLNKGTNFLLGEISFVSDSVAVILQLALAIDYAIILCHRYSEEHAALAAREAAIAALSKAIPEISGSSLTTLSGLGAICFMQFGIGRDLGFVLMKAIALSLLSVFTLMPGLLVSFSPLIDRTHHRSFVPKISVWGRIVVKLRYITPPLFLLLIVAGFVCSGRCPYAYSMTDLHTFAKNDAQLAEEKINDAFGRQNTLAVLVPSGDYDREARLLRDLDAMPETESVLGLANVDTGEGYVLTDRLTPRQFSELADLDIEAARLLYSAYAINQETYGRLVSGIDSYSVPLLDMFTFVHEQADEGYVNLDESMMDSIDELYDRLSDACLQLKGENYSRLVMQLNLPEESEETFAFLDRVHETAERYYDSCVLVGNSTSSRDLSESFAGDNLLISILTVIFVVAVLMFTFQSAGLPLLLILVIQGSVWINFSFPYIMGEKLFFLSYLVVSSIQMGANIDYAIVIASRYTELKKVMPLKQAVIEALNEAFPTIATSGTILACAGVLIGLLSSSPPIASIGVCLGRGTIISIFLVMLILPQLLLLGDIIIEKTAFTIKAALPVRTRSGNLHIEGHVRGYVSGIVDADFSGSLHGTLSASVAAGRAFRRDAPELCEAESDETENIGKEAAPDEEENA